MTRAAFYRQEAEDAGYMVAGWLANITPVVGEGYDRSVYELARVAGHFGRLALELEGREAWEALRASMSGGAQDLYCRRLIADAIAENNVLRTRLAAAYLGQ